jgi:glycosyltransferase involved in cell wall biosynthesis
MMAAVPFRPHPRERVAVPTRRAAPAPVARPATRPVVVFLSGEPATPGHLYRVARASDAATATGLANVVLTAAAVRDHLSTISHAAVLWLWRTRLTTPVSAAIEAARRGGARIIYDIDDLMIDPQLAVPRIIDGMRSQRQTTASVAAYFEAARACMLRADLCIASTEELAGHMRAAGVPTLVIPNGFDHALAMRARAAAATRPDDGLLRIGYAAGSRTHQRDFVIGAAAICFALCHYPQTRLVLFSFNGRPLVDISEFAQLYDLGDRVEIRKWCEPDALPAELARFDINLAPIETGNPFCEAKSELKFFEAALVGVPTIASPTGPFARAIRHNETGILARTRADWLTGIMKLIERPAERQRLAAAAKRDVLWTFGPERRAELIADAIDLAGGGRRAAQAFARATQVHRTRQVPLVDATTRFVAEQHQRAAVTVVIPLFDYAEFIVEALDSVVAQTVPDLDLIVVDDGSRDGSRKRARAWLTDHTARFGRAMLLQHRANAGLAAARNTGFAHAETPWVLALDADNRLRPTCVRTLLTAVEASDAVFAYPTLQHFGEDHGTRGDRAYDPAHFIGGNYIDALALIARGAWAAVGGYQSVCTTEGWEDYDLWCRLAELGLRGVHAGDEPLAEYRVHSDSMSHRAGAAGAAQLRAAMTQQHAWLRPA